MKRFYVGIKGVVHDKVQGYVLLQKGEGEKAFWEVPGGRMEEGENFEDALRRELAEELPGIEVIKVGGASRRLHY